VLIGTAAAAGAVYGSIDGATFPNKMWIWIILGWIALGTVIVAVKHGRGTFAVAASKQRAPARASGAAVPPAGPGQ
jgi:hypothetical protein